MRGLSVRVAVLLALAPYAWAQVKLSKTFKDTRTGLIVHYPAGWRTDTALFQGFNIIDFSPNERPPQVLVPMDRADIGIFAPPEGEKTIAEWMQDERISESRGASISEETLATKHLGTLTLTVARSEPKVIPGATSVLFFFKAEGRPIKAALTYRGQRRASEFEAVFRSIIEGLEPLSGH